MAVGDIYELKVYQDYIPLVRECLNVYHVRQTSAGGNAEDVITAYLADVDTLLRAWQMNFMRTSFLECRNLFNVTDFATSDVTAASLVGAHTGEVLPVHDVITFRLVRTTREIRNGYKRYSGIGEAYQQSGVITDATLITEIDDFREALAGDWSAGDFVGNLVVVKRISYPDPEDPDKTLYRLPLNAVEAEYSDPADVLVNLTIRTQDTRKRP